MWAYFTLRNGWGRESEIINDGALAIAERGRPHGNKNERKKELSLKEEEIYFNKKN